MSYDLTVNYDGACGPVNPGGTASWGIVAKNVAGEVVMSAHGITGSGRGMSNNVAEYDALCQALKLVEDMAAPGWRVLVQGDSKLTVEQMAGKWKVHRWKKGRYLAKHDEAAGLLARLVAAGIKVDLRWVPREENAEADLQSTRALALANIPLFRKPRWRGRGSYSEGREAGGGEGRCAATGGVGESGVVQAVVSDV